MRYALLGLAQLKLTPVYMYHKTKLEQKKIKQYQLVHWVKSAWKCYEVKTCNYYFSRIHIVIICFTVKPCSARAL